MKDFKNIDRLFQEKFRDFEQKPPAHVWENISSILSGKQKKDRHPLWLWLSGVAAGLAVLFSLNNPFTTPNTLNNHSTDTEGKSIQKINSLDKETTILTNKNTITKQESIEKNTPVKIKPNTRSIPDVPVKTQNTIVTISTPDNTDSNKNSLLNSSKKAKTSVVANKEEKQKNNLQESVTKNILQNKNEIVQITSIPVEKSTTQKKNLKQIKEVIADTNPASNSLESLPEKASNSHDIVTKSNKWTIAAVAAPVLFNAFESDVSSIDKNFDNNTKQGQLSAAYGVQLAYQVSNRFSIQTGIHKVNYGYKTEGAYVSPNSYADTNSTISYNDIININDVKPAPPSNADIVYQETGDIISTGDLVQVLGYYEIPVEAKFAIVKGNLGVNILSGFSTLIRNKDEIYYQIDNVSNKVDKTSGLNSLNFTGNVGFEIDYKVYQNVHFNVTPVFKIHTNTFKNNTKNIKPYAMGVYSGLNFRF